MRDSSVFGESLSCAGGVTSFSKEEERDRGGESAPPYRETPPHSSNARAADT